MRWRDPKDQPSGELLIVSPHDLEARLSKKRDTSWSGYKVHVTETCEPDRLHLIEHVETTASTVTDEQIVSMIHVGLKAEDLLPSEHLVDNGYVDSARLAESRTGYGVDLVGPAPADTSSQAREGKGFDAGSFSVDWEAEDCHLSWGREECRLEPDTRPARQGCHPRASAARSAQTARAPRTWGAPYAAPQAAARGITGSKGKATDGGVLGAVRGTRRGCRHSNCAGADT